MTPIDIPEEVLSRELDGEAVLLDLRSGKYFGLNGTGAVIWAAMNDGLEPPQMAERLANGFDVTVEQARADVDAFIESLVSRGLIRVRTVKA